MTFVFKLKNKLLCTAETFGATQPKTNSTAAVAHLGAVTVKTAATGVKLLRGLISKKHFS